MSAQRRQPGGPEIEIKVFTSRREIEQGIAKLRRRLDEVRALDPGKTHYDDQTVRNVEENIGTSILEVFGPRSPEYGNRRRGFREGSFYFGQSNAQLQADFAEGIPQMAKYLEGLIARLEEKRESLVQTLRPVSRLLSKIWICTHG